MVGTLFCRVEVPTFVASLKQRWCVARRALAPRHLRGVRGIPPFRGTGTGPAIASRLPGARARCRLGRDPVPRRPSDAALDRPGRHSRCRCCRDPAATARICVAATPGRGVGTPCAVAPVRSGGVRSGCRRRTSPLRRREHQLARPGPCLGTGMSGPMAAGARDGAARARGGDPAYERARRWDGTRRAGGWRDPGQVDVGRAGLGRAAVARSHGDPPRWWIVPAATPLFLALSS